MYCNVFIYSKVTCFCNILILTNVNFVTVSSPGNLSLESPLLTPAQSLTTVTSTATNLTLGKPCLCHFTTILITLLRHTQNLQITLTTLMEDTTYTKYVQYNIVAWSHVSPSSARYHFTLKTALYGCSQ